MSKIQDKDRYYHLLRYHVDFMFKAAYRRVEYHGKEKIPRDGAIIYACNHTNTLMDPLAILAIDKSAKVFVARADIFKHPLLLKFLTFLKMLPINRKRDGVENLAKNEDINEIVVDALHDKTPFCILPEGTHRPMHSLMSLQKGLFRIALQANDTFGNEMPVYIAPVGIEYGHFFRFRSSLLVQIGAPINVTQFVKKNPLLTLPQQINELRDKLSSQLKKLTLDIADDACYNATSELMQLYESEQLRKINLDGSSLINRFTAAKKTIRDVASFLKSNPTKMQKVLELTGDFARQRKAQAIGIESVLKKHIRLSLLLNVLLLFIGLPYFIFSAVVTSPVTLLSIFLCSKFKDNAFHNSVRYLTALALLPVLLLLIGVVIFILLPWMWGVAFVLLFTPSFFFLHEYLRLIRLICSDVKWLINRSLYRQFKKIKILMARLII